MNEAETRAELIDPAIASAGWGKVDASRVMREGMYLGRLLVLLEDSVRSVILVF